MRYLQGTHESVYEYDGDSKRVRIKELTSSVETKNETFVWCGSRICQKRSGSTVVRNYFEQGFEEGTTDYFYSRDRLGSVREVVGSNGTTIASRLSYDPWGAITESGSGAVADFGFTGHYFDRPTGLGLTWFRGYDPSLGRWLSQDPIGLRGGLNLYGYVNNQPLTSIDPSGLTPQDLKECLAVQRWACDYFHPGGTRNEKAWCQCKCEAARKCKVVECGSDQGCKNQVETEWSLCDAGCPAGGKCQ